MCTIIKQIQRHSFVTFYWLHEWFFCRNQRLITQSINWEILKTKSQQNSVFLNQKLNLFWTSVIITFSVRSDMVRTSHLSMIAGPKDQLCKILKALTAEYSKKESRLCLWNMVVLITLYKRKFHSKNIKRGKITDMLDHVITGPYYGDLLMFCTYNYYDCDNSPQITKNPPHWQTSYTRLCRARIHLTHWGRDNMAAISKTTLSNAFSWMIILEFGFKFHLSLFLRVQWTKSQHWFR